MVAFAAIYATVVWMTGPTVAPVPGGWRASRRAVVVGAVLAVMALAVPLAVGGIQ